jgi:hypothetical protein
MSTPGRGHDLQSGSAKGTSLRAHRSVRNVGCADGAMALLLSDLPGVEHVELDSAGDAGLAGLAGGESPDSLGFPRAGPVWAVPVEAAGGSARGTNRITTASFDSQELLTGEPSASYE